MSITNDKELRAAAEKVGEILQEIQDYAQRDFTGKPWKIRFPRGYIRTAQEHRERLRSVGVEQRCLADNIAYTLMLSDVLHWLLVKTDLSATARDMVTKVDLFILGALVESITKHVLKGECAKGYKERTKYLCDRSIITKDLKNDLDWLWDVRNNMHLFLLKDSEYNSRDYTTSNFNRAVKAWRGLLEALKAHHEA